MNNKTTIIYRVLFAAAFLLLAAGLFSATRVQSADPMALNAVEIVVTPITAMETTEIGGTAQFSVRLGDLPIDTVTIAVNSDTPAEGLVTAPVTLPLTFTTSDYDVAQTITVTGQNDDIDDGPVVYNIVLDPASTGDPNYNSLPNKNVELTNQDDDTAGLTVVTTPPMQTTEGSGTASFTVALSTQPTDTVTIALSSNDTTEGQVTSSTNLTFTTGNWNSAQSVTVTGQNDDLDDGNIGYNIVLNPASPGDSVYNALPNVLVPVTNLDNDIAGLTVVTTPPMQTTEGSGTASFTVALSTQPTDTVTVALSSSDTTEGQVTSSTNLTFTTGNWNSAQSVTVTGQNDDLDDGNIGYNIVLNPASTGDSVYNALPNVLVPVTNLDDDTAGLTVVTTPPMQTTEGSGTASFTVALSSEPLGDVTIALSSNNTSEGTITTPVVPTLTFTNVNWNTPQPVIITGVDDFIVDGDIAYLIILNPASLIDTSYNALPDINVGVSNLDNDVIGFTIFPTTGLITSENGVPTASFDVVLDTMPSANVTLAITSSDPSEGTVNKSSLTFTPAGPLNIWSIPQTVTVTGVDDSIADGDITFDIITGPVTTTDPDYAALDPVTEIPDVEVTNSDNDIPGLTIAPSTELWVTEGGDSLTFNVLLRSQPTAGVSLALASSNTSEGTLNKSSLAFTTANWNVAQSFTVTGVDDCKDNPLGDTFKVSIMATSADLTYNGTYEERTLINLDAPTIAWSKPVKTDEIYYYSGFGPIDLEAKSICPEEIQKVEFYYYVDTPFPQWVDIGQDPTAPYRERIEADEITTLWTQVFAFAYGPPNPVVGKQTFSKHERILVLNEIIKLVMLPFVSK